MISSDKKILPTSRLEKVIKRKDKSRLSTSLRSADPDLHHIKMTSYQLQTDETVSSSFL
jgi:hypothetical protein